MDTFAYYFAFALLQVVAFGQLVQFGPSKDADGNAIVPCFTTSDGLRMHGEEWQTFSGDWMVKCDNGTIRITACLGSARSGYAVIPIGETAEVNGFWHKCELIEDKQNVRYTEEFGCQLRGKELKVNETTRNGLFEMRCLENKWDIVGCYYYTQAGEAKMLKLGDTAKEGNYLHKCESINETSVLYSYEAVGCQYNGTTYEPGQTWSNGKIKFECKEKGAYEGVACIGEDGIELKVGEDKVTEKDKGQKYLQRCFRMGSTVVYQAYPCGEGDGLRTCTPPPAEEKTPEGLRPIVPPGTVGVPQVAPAALPAGMPNVPAHNVNQANTDMRTPSKLETSLVLSGPPTFQPSNFQPIIQHMQRTTKWCTETSLPTELVATP